MDWTDLHTFLVVANAGSIARAARELQVNHSTVLRRLAQLEAAMGLRLFDRRPSGYALTAAGEHLEQQLAGVREQIESTERQLGGADLGLRGTIRLTTTDTLIHGLLLPHLVAFQRQQAGIDLQVVINNSFLNLTKREADVAVRGSNTPPGNLIGRFAGHIQTAPYVSKALIDGGRLPPLEELDWVGLDDGLAHLEQARWLASTIAPERVRMRLDSLVGMVDAVRHGVGAAMLLCPLAESHADLLQLAPPAAEMDTQLWVLTHPDLKQVARIKAFTEFLYRRLRDDPRLLHDRKARPGPGRQAAAMPRKRAVPRAANG